MNAKTAEERTTSMKERLPEVREQVRERVQNWREDNKMPEAQTVEAAAGSVLLGTGVLAAASATRSDKRGIAKWGAPAILLGGGVSLLLTALVEHRHDHINRVEQSVREDLSELGPIARAQVLKDMAQEQVPVLRGGSRES